jgi:dTDP-4-dehydrorhamnose reductase
MVKACAGFRIPFVHLSSDYVFEGLGVVSWHTDDVTRPQFAYYRSKLVGVEVVQ